MNKLPEIIKLIKELQIDKVIKIVETSNFTSEDAEELFIFLYNYTNSFKNYNTTPEVVKLAWKMLQYWISHDRIIIAKNKRSITEMKFYSEIIKTLKLYKNGEFAGFIVTKDIMDKFQLRPRNINWFIHNLLSIIAGTKFGFLLIENWENESILHFVSKYKSEDTERLRELFWVTYDNKTVNMNYKNILDIITK